MYIRVVLRQENASPTKATEKVVRHLTGVGVGYQEVVSVWIVQSHASLAKELNLLI